MNAEDAKLITLAKGARTRVRATSGAAVRDDTGRTYAATEVALNSLQLTALQMAVATAVAAGARGLEAAAVVAAVPEITAADREVISDAGGAGMALILTDSAGNVTGIEPA